MKNMLAHSERNTNCDDTKMAPSPIRLAKIPKLDNTPYWRGCGRIGILVPCEWKSNGKTLRGLDKTRLN